MEEKILDLLKREVPDIDFESSNQLVDDGIMDSVTMVEVITALSEEYGVSIPYEDIVAENFNSITAMTQMIERLQI